MNILRLNTTHSETTFHDVVNRFDRVKRNQDLNNVLLESQKQYGLKNVAYLGYNLGKISTIEPFSIVTYSQNWIDHYRAKNYFEVDPVLKEVRKSIVPLDWNDIEISSKKARNFFNEAIDAGVGRYGISIPVRGRNNDYSIFSLTFDESERDWEHFKNYYMRDFNILAFYFHKTVLEVNEIVPPEFNLSSRQLEVLYWAACGKSSEETAVILGISKSTVRFHVTNILTKLNAVNITHAVAKAMFYGLLPLPR